MAVAKKTAMKRAPQRKQRRARARNPRLGVSSCGNRYANCVLSPSGAPAKVPDGSSNSVLIEYDLAVTGVPNGNGDLSLALIPGLPCSAWGMNGTFSGPNRNGVISSNTTNTDFVLFPFQDFNSGVAAAINGSTVLYNAPSEITAARVVSSKLEVVPTGALLQQGGSVATARVPMTFRISAPMGDAGIQLDGVTYAGASSHPWFLWTELPPEGFTQLAAYPDAKICSGTESCVLLGIPSDDDYHPSVYDWLSTSSDDPSIIITGDTYPYFSRIQAGLAAGHQSTNLGTIALNGGSKPGAAMLPSSATDIALFGNFWQPEQCQALVWAGQGLPAGQAYTFRVRVCMELQISHAASNYRPFVTPAEPDDPRARELVRDVMRSVPPSLPKESSMPGWWAGLAQAATGVAGSIAELGIPVISPVAGVARRVMGALGL